MNLPEAPYQSEYVHCQHEKFWEIRVYNNCTTLIRCGRLGPDNQEDLSSVQTVQKSYNSNEDAIYAAQRLVETKISKGYQYLNEENSLKRPPPAELFEEDIIMKQVKVDPVQEKSMRQDFEDESIFRLPTECMVDIGDFSVDQKTKLLQKAFELEVSCSFEKGSVVLRGLEENLKLAKAFIVQLQKQASEKNGNPVSIPISPKLYRQGSELEKLGLEMGLICEIRKEKVMVLGEEEKVEAFKAFIVAKELEPGPTEVKKVVPPPQKVVKDEENDFIQKEINMTSRLNNQRSIIENKLKEIGMFYEFREGKLYMLGPKKSITMITDLVASLERTNTNYQTDFVGNPYPSYSYSDNRSPTHNSYTNSYTTTSANNGVKNQGKGNVATQPKPPSSTHDPQSGSTKVKINDIDPSIMEDIKKKAEELGIVATYSKNGLSIYTQKGQKVNEQFTAYINARKAAKVQEDMKATSKRGLYPKNWNYDEKQPFAKIRIKKGTDEYQEVADRFLESMNDDFQVTKIHRIQNAQAMDQHIDNLVKRMENKIRDPYQRRLLYQSAADLCVDPLDPSYNALNVPEEGIYLAMNAEEFSKDAENGNGGYRMYLSDVYIGRQAQDEGQGLPPGYDSVKSGVYHVIYDGLQGYQLYEIDYKMIDDSNVDSDDDCYS